MKKKDDKMYYYKYSSNIDDLISKLNIGKYYGEYLIAYQDEHNFSIGVERLGHSSGRWYEATIQRKDDWYLIKGEFVVLPKTDNNNSKISFLETLKLVLMFTILLPLEIIFAVGMFISWIIKIINKDPFATLNPEKRLDYFMINYLGCEKLCVDNEQANLKEVVEEDWRLSQGDFDYIKNHVFKKQYFKSNKNNDHDHCNFCWTKITDLEIGEEHDTFGYVTLNAHGQEEWVCEKCFNDFKERFNFKVEGNNSIDKLVRYISEYDRKYYTMMLEILMSLDIPDDYKWLITDVEAYPKDDEVSDKLKKSLIISNKELVEMLKKDDFQWIWAVFSLFKPNVENNKIIQESPMLYSQIESKFYETPVIQHSLAILEIDAFDSSYVMITSKEAIYLERFKKLFRQSRRQEEGDNYV